MKTYDVVFTALTRDNMEHLPHLIEDLAAMGTTLFRSFAFVISENDSLDGTKEYMQKLQKNSSSYPFPVTRVGEDFHNKKRPSTSFLAKMRNYYLREIYENPFYDNYDYMIVFDTDFEREKFVKPEGLINSFNRTDEWDVLAANGERWDKIWDAFAFRNDEFDLPFVPENFPEGIGSYWPTILHIQKKYEDGPLIPVKSAFGGFAIYKLRTLRGLLHDETSEDCERVSLHSQIMARGGKIFMNPNMRLTYF
jgi:hypothetical protein